MRPAPALATSVIALAATSVLAAPAQAVAPSTTVRSGSGTSAGFPTRVLAPDAIFYRRLPDATPKAADSATLVRSLVSQAEDAWGQPGKPNIDINYDKFSPTMYVAHNSDPVATFSADNCQGKWDGYADELLSTQLNNIHIPAGARPDASDDGLMVVYNPDQDTVTETWVTHKTGGSSYSACWGGTLRHASKSKDGRFSSDFGASASGLAQAAYVIRASELKAGKINHVINLEIPQTAAWPKRSWPASRTDGYWKGPALAEGQLLRIPRSVNLDAMKLSPVARTIAKAAQDYGIMITETSGAVTFVAENPAALASNPYPSIFRGRYAAQELAGDEDRGEQGFPLDKLVAMPVDYRVPLTTTLRKTTASKTTTVKKATAVAKTTAVTKATAVQATTTAAQHTSVARVAGPATWSCS